MTICVLIYAAAQLQKCLINLLTYLLTYLLTKAMRHAILLILNVEN